MRATVKARRRALEPRPTLILEKSKTKLVLMSKVADVEPHRKLRKLRLAKRGWVTMTVSVHKSLRQHAQIEGSTSAECSLTCSTATRPGVEADVSTHCTLPES